MSVANEGNVVNEVSAESEVKPASEATAHGQVSGSNGASQVILVTLFQIQLYEAENERGNGIECGNVSETKIDEVVNVILF